MEPLRSQLQPQELSGLPGPTMFKTERNEHEVRCGMCGRISYVNDDVFEGIRMAVDSGLDYPFSCEICEKEYDELVYEG